MKISSLQRIYVTSTLKSGAVILLDQEQNHYLTSVVRLKVDRQFRIFNENSGEFIAKISSVSKKSCEIKVMELLRSPSKTARLCLAQGIIKGDRMMDALSMATQLGVTEIVPIITERTQIKTINHERVRRVLIENSEQSERLSVPQPRDPQELKELLYNSDFDLLLYANENERGRGIKAKLSVDRIAVLVGPEGGFTDDELAMLKDNPKACSVGLGETVLRSETATASILALVQSLR